VLNPWLSLPRLRAAVERALRSCSDRLAQFPPVPQGVPSARIMMMINEFLREVDSGSVGDSHKTLAQDCRASYLSLREKIFATCPKFQLEDDDDAMVSVGNLGAPAVQMSSSTGNHRMHRRKTQREAPATQPSES
jgi:hypothetical protein